MMEYLKFGDRVIRFNWNRILKETPQIFYDPLSEDYVDNKLREPIANAFNSNGIYPTNNENIFHIPKLISCILLYVVDGNFIGAVDFDTEYIDGESYFVPTLAKKFEQDYKGVLHTLYKHTGNHFKKKIVSDKLQSLDSSSVWKKWFLNPEKYDIEEVYTIPKGLSKLDDILGQDEKYKDVRVVVKFKE